MLDSIKHALEEKKAEDIAILEVHDLTTVCDYMLVASGNSSPQLRALADQVIETAKKLNIEVLGVEGVDNREWILVDLGNIIVHIMLPTARAYYELEKLWNV